MSTVDTDILCARANQDRTLFSFEKALEACYADPIGGEPRILHLTLAPGVGGGHVEFFLSPATNDTCLVIEMWRGTSCFLRTNHGVMTNVSAWRLVTCTTTSEEAQNRRVLLEKGTG